MQDFRKRLVELGPDPDTQEFSPLQVGGLRFWIQAGVERCSLPRGARALEDVTHWEVVVLSPERLTQGPAEIPALFVGMPWIRFWRVHPTADGRRAHVGEFVPTHLVQQLLGFAAETEPPTDPGQEERGALRRLIERQEREQQQLELEWEVDGRLGFRRFYF